MKKKQKNYNEKNVKKISIKNKNKLESLLFIAIIINFVSYIEDKNIKTRPKRNLQTAYSEITLRISGKGTQQILYDTFKPIPYYLEVNSVQTTFNYTINNLKYDKNNKIVMRFNSNITSCENMFSGLRNITQLDMTNFDFSEITSMKNMFYDDINLWEIKLNANNKISKIVDLENMFKGCNILKSIQLYMLDTSLVTNMANMFRECYKIEYLNISNFNTSIVTDMQYMFYGCGLLTTLNLNNFNTSSVTNMANMFNSCYKLTSINLTNFKTNLVNDMNSMFSFCNSLNTLNLTNFNTSLVKNMSNLFHGCISLEKLDLSNFKTSLVTDMSYMFNGCTELSLLDLSNFNTSLVTNMEYMFGSCYLLTSLNLYSFNTTLVTNMKFMFFECNLLTNLNITIFKTSLVNNMQNMFSGCKFLTSIDLSSFNTTIVNNMEYMFSECNSLTSLDIINFDTSIVTNMEFMFYGCNKLNYVDLSKFKTSNVNNMNSMFYNCNSLTSLYLGNFITNKVRNMNSMFYGCSNLKYLDISGFDTSLVTDMNSMFFQCNELTSFNLYHFDITNTINMGSMFYSCTKMNYLNFYHFKENDSLVIYDIFEKSTNTLKYCISSEENSYKLLSEINLIENTERENTLIEKEKCIDKCSNDDTYNYEYNNVCYNECPKTSYLSNSTNYLCEPIICKKYYNYDRTGCLEYIPETYFLNNSQKGTIDKCHSDCRTCVQKESINSTNCQSCLNSKFLDLGNCISICPDNLYVEEKTDTYVNLKCKCSYNKKCLFCTLDSLKYDLCISCNTEEGYYPKEKDVANNNTFINCYKDLEGYYLDINDNIFKKCYSTCKNCNQSGNITNNNCLECITNHMFRDDFKNDSKCYENCLYYYYFDLENNYYCTEKNQCPENYNKLILEKNKCIDECFNDNIYKYEYKNKCYKSCPEGTEILVNNSHICELKCQNSIYIDLKNKTCLEKCEINDFFSGNCGLLEPTLESQQIHIKNIINEIENGEMDNLLLDIFNNNLTVTDNNIIYQIISIDEINLSGNYSIIQLEKCKDILMKKHINSKNKKILLFKTDYYINELLIPITDYLIFNPDNNKKLNLSDCKNEFVDIYSPILFNEIEENLLKYDPSSDYYNDNCFPTKTEFGTDIILKDRKKEFNENYLSLCEKDCLFIEYNSEIKKSKCKCPIKTESSLLLNSYMNKNNLIYQFSDIEKYENLNIFKCNRILFTHEGLETNIASYIIIVIFVLYTFQLCFLHMKVKEINNKKKFVKNENISSFKIQKNPPRKMIKRKTSLYEDLVSIFNKRNNSKKYTLQIKSSKDIIPKSGKNKELFNSILVNFKNEDKNKNNILYMKDSELNLLSYQKAKILDKRTYFQYYLSLIKIKYIVIASFCSDEEYDLIYMNRCIFINSFILFYLINSFFFTNSTIHEIYINKKYRISLTKIVFSTLISSVIIILVRFICIPQIKTNKIRNEKSNNNKKICCIEYKNNLIYLIMYIFVIFSWYYLSAFCAVYRNSQIHLFKNVLISYSIFLIYPIIFYLIPGWFRIPSLEHSKKSSECIYNLSKVIQFF